MECNVLVCAREAYINPETGRLSILGIVDKLQPEHFPIKVDDFTAVCRLAAMEHEFGKRFKLVVKLLDAEKRVVCEWTQRMKVPRMPGRRYISMKVIIHDHQGEGQIKRPGLYELVAYVDSQIVAISPLEVVVRDEDQS